MGDKIALRARLANRAQPLCLSRPERKKPCNSSPHYFVFPHQGWEGERIFPDSIATYTHEGIPYEVQCFNFVNFTTSCEADEPVCQKFQLVNPFYDDLYACVGDKCSDNGQIEQCQKKVCPDWAVSADGEPACERACFMICPSVKIYTSSDYRLMWIVYTIPGLCAIPMNFYICVGFWVGRKQIHKKSKPFLKVAGALMLLWGILNVLPSTIMYTDLMCNHGTTLSIGEKLICIFHRGTVHLIQAAYYWMTAAITDLFMAIVLEFPDRKRTARGKVIMALATGIPFIMMCWTHGNAVTDEESLILTFDGQNGIEYPNLVWNSSKDFFTCSPRLRYFWEEIVVVHIHFVIGAILMVPMLASICYKLVVKSAFMTSHDKSSWFVKLGIVFKKSGSKKLVIMGSLVTFLLVLQLVAVANIFPKMKDFATKDKEYDSCKYGVRAAFIGQKCLEDSSCCDSLNPSALGFAPNALLLTFGYFFPVSAISFVYAVTCVSDQGHLKVWKKMLGIKSTGMERMSCTPWYIYIIDGCTDWQKISTCDRRGQRQKREAWKYSQYARCSSVREKAVKK
jgi:hypothetical protein